jgi:hypothetical protein
MTILKKSVQHSYIRGTPGVVGSPGSPARPAYCVTTSVPETSQTGYYTLIPGEPPASDHYVFTPTGTKTSYVNVTTCYPASPAIAPVIGVPSTPAQLLTDFNIGWNSGAVSVGLIEGDAAFVVNVPTSSVGVVVGLNNNSEGVGYKDIDYGFYFSNGKAIVYESGVAKTASYTNAGTENFSVQRRAGAVSYYRDATLLYTSAVSSYGMLVGDSSLYMGGDSISGASFATTLHGESGANTRFEPMQSMAAAETYAASAAALLPMATAITSHASVGSTVSLRPLQSIGSNKAYADGRVSLSALEVTANAGDLTPSFAVSATSMAYLLSASHGLTGGNGESEANFEKLKTIGADHPYGVSEATLSTFDAFGGESIPINAFALLGLDRAFSVQASGSPLPQNSFSGRMALSAIAYGGATAKLAMATPIFVSTGVGVVVGRARISMPSAALSASGQTGGIGKASLKISNRYEVSAFAGAVVSVTLNDGFSLSASGASGAIGAATIRMPLFELVSSGGAVDHGQMLASMPSLRAVPSALARLVGPSGYLSAVGSAVVAVSYEAYAVNLLPGKDQLNQVTHYTNFPFNQILRYQGAYYGVADDGLFLLEGDTDDGDAIAWGFDTHQTDFGSRQQKRAAAAYIGGRIDGEIDVTVAVGEKSESEYGYRAVRGDDVQNYRVKFGKGLKSRYYGFGMSDTGGSFVEIDSIDIDVDILGRAI